MAEIKTYSHGVPQEEAAGLSAGYCVNGTIYISGQMSHDMQGAFVGEGDIEAQTRQTHENIDRVLAGFGVTRTNIAEMQIFMTDPQRDQERFIPLHHQYLGDHRPAVTLIGVASLPGGPRQLIEIKVIAHTD
ncbi:RidA family protein [Kribbia dieselivorans]|uniref:RidA family protein n=1 Tax=Kribbia dieselivorans TaxID=331526 RepID=UPI0008390C2F|nr:RidA family protein [Kribbia dieselivorans]